MKNKGEFADVAFPDDYDNLLVLTKNLIGVNRRLVGIISNQHYVFDEITDAYQNDDQLTFIDMMERFIASRTTAKAMVKAQQMAGILPFPLIH